MFPSKLNGRLRFALLCGLALLLTAALALSASAAYPSSGTSVPSGSTLLEGEPIGEVAGWSGQTDKGRDAMFDGDIRTYYDPSAKSSEDAYAGMDFGVPVVLTKVMIHPRENWLDRFNGASIQGSNDLEEWETLWVSPGRAAEWEWQEITDFDNNTGYQFMRYWNGREHGDVAEVEFYGHPVSGDGPVQLKGEVIGEMIGWDGTANTGAAAAFDGDRYSYYDPTQQGGEGNYTGLDLGKEYILTSVRVLPREAQPARFRGAEIQGSNDMKKWTSLCASDHGASTWEWQIFTDFDDNTGYRYYRYWNGKEHGDVAEIRLFGYPADGNYTPPSPATLAAEVTEVTVRFDANGADYTPDPVTVKIGEPYGDLGEVYMVALANPPGIFKGWYTSRTGGVRVDADTVVTRLADHTLHAQWGGREAEQPAASDPTAPAASVEPSADPGAETGGTEEKRSFVVPAVCIAVSAVSLGAALLFMAGKKED